MYTLKKFQANLQGTDYVVGDIHGQFHLLEQAIQQIGFDTKIDRLFAVGDLVDRGEQSLQVLNWLEKPFFYSVLGNHEHYLIEADCASGAGDEWFWKLSSAEKRPFLEAFKRLPLAIEIDSPNGNAGIVHADLLDDWDFFVKNLTKYQSIALWSRERCYHPQGVVKGIDRVYIGHTVHDRPTWYGNVCCIDTGSGYKDRTLTILPAFGA